MDFGISPTSPPLPLPPTIVRWYDASTFVLRISRLIGNFLIEAAWSVAKSAVTRNGVNNNSSMCQPSRSIIWSSNFQKFRPSIVTRVIFHKTNIFLFLIMWIFRAYTHKPYTFFTYIHKWDKSIVRISHILTNTHHW